MPGISIAAVIPCYNAGRRVRPVVEGVLASLGRVFLVDDGSADGAVEGLRDLPINVVTHPENRGKGHAILTGIEAALADPDVGAVCLIDADGQHDPAEISRLIDTFEGEEADLVIGSRVFDRRNVPLRNRLGNRLTITCTALLLGRRIPDTQCGFRVLSRRFAEDLMAHVPGGRYEMEMEMVVRAVRGGFRVSSVPIKTIYEEGNTSSHFHKLRDSYLIYARLLRSTFFHRK